MRNALNTIGIMLVVLMLPVTMFAQGSDQTINTGEGGQETVNTGEGGAPIESPTPQRRPQQGGGGGVSIQNPLQAESITDFFIDIIEVLLVFATPIIVFFIILSGFKYVLARGNPEKVSEANRALLYSIIGGLLILGAFVILQVIQGTIDAITL